MYDASDIERVRELLAHGWSKAAIARHLKISRRVIYNWAASGLLTAPALQPRTRASAGSKLDAFEQAIARQLSANPAVSARQILRELRTLGYTGEITQLRKYLSSRRQTFIERVTENSRTHSLSHKRTQHVG